MDPATRAVIERARDAALAQAAALDALLAGTPTEEEWIAVGDAARLAKVDKDTIREWARRHGLGHQVAGPGSAWRISLAKLRARVPGL